MSDLEGFARYLSVERGLLPQTVAAYVHEVDDWLAWRHGSAETPAAGTRSWIADRGGSSSTVVRRLAAVRAWSFYSGQADPTARLSRPKRRHHLPRPVLDLAERLEKVDDLVTLSLATLLAQTGLRVSELAAVLAAPPTLPCEELLVRGKGERDRIVPLSEGARTALAVLIDRGSRPSVRQIQRRLQPLGITPHRLRHTFATRLIRSGADLGDVQLLLGHSSPATTTVYASFGQDRLRAAVERATATDV